MKRLDYFKAIAELFAFKTIADDMGNEYVLYQNSAIDSISGIEDKTAFEALENHVHLLERVKPSEFDFLAEIGANLGRALLASLKFTFPEKSFFVFVTISSGDSFIIRFHQKWENEVPYIDLAWVRSSRERVFGFEA